MKISENIRALFVFLITIGAIGALIVMAFLIAPIINRYPQMSLRLVIALLLTFVTAKFLFYIAEALLVVIGNRSERTATRIRSAHPAVRGIVIAAVILLAFVGWYFLFAYLKGAIR